MLNLHGVWDLVALAGSLGYHLQVSRTSHKSWDLLIVKLISSYWEFDFLIPEITVLALWDGMLLSRVSMSF